MDPQKLKEVFDRLEALDDRLSYRLRRGTVAGSHRASPEELEERLRDVTSYVLELRELVRDLMLAIAARPSATEPR